MNNKNTHTPYCEVCEGNLHAKSLVDSRKEDIDMTLTPLGYLITSSKTSVENAIYSQIISLALSNTKSYMTTSVDPINHFFNNIKVKDIPKHPFPFDEFRIVEYRDLDIDGHFKRTINYDSTCYVSFKCDTRGAEVMFRNVKTGVYQVIFIKTNADTPHNIYDSDMFIPRSNNTKRSDVFIYYNEIQTGNMNNYIGNYLYESILFQNIPKSEWKYRYPLYKKNEIINDTNDDILGISEHKKLICMDDDLETYVYRFMKRFCEEFDSLIKQLRYLVCDLEDVQPFSTLVDRVSANDISKLYRNSIPLSAEHHKDLNKRYVINVTQNIKLSDLYETWFFHTLKKKHCETLDSMFDGTLGEFCTNYTVDKIVKHFPGIGKKTATYLNEEIRCRTDDIMYIGMDPLEKDD